MEGLWPWRRTLGLWGGRTILELFSPLWVPAVVVGPPLPHLGFASAALGQRQCVVVVVVVCPSSPLGGGLPVAPLDCLGGLWACGSRRGLGTRPGHSRCGQVVVAWLALSPSLSGLFPPPSWLVWVLQGKLGLCSGKPHISIPFGRDREVVELMILGQCAHIRYCGSPGHGVCTVLVPLFLPQHPCRGSRSPRK